MRLVDAHPDAIEADLKRRRQGKSLVEEGLELSKDLRAYVRQAWHIIRPEDKFIDNWHIGAMCECFTAVSAGEIRRLAIWVPPGSMKTITGSVSWPTWVWTWNPGWRLMSCTYDMEMQVEQGMLPSRALIQNDWYQDRFGHIYALLSDLNKRAVYANDRGGARYAAAPNAKKVTGRHVHCILLDDPNDATSVEGISENALNSINNWHDGTLPTRYANPETGAKVIIQQRLHEKDLSGHVVDDTWEVLCLPERYEPKHPFVWPDDPRSEPGELLWPARVGESANAERRKTLGGHRSSGQLQQEPAAREGEILKRAYWRYYAREALELAEAGDVTRFPPFAIILSSWDTAFEDSSQSDPVAGGIFGVFGGDRYLLKTRYERMGLAATKTAMLEMHAWAGARWPRARHYVLVEKKSNGAKIIAQLKREIPGVNAYNPGNSDKVKRAEEAEPDFESGNVFICGAPNGEYDDYDPTRTPAWAQEVIEQCARFPKAAHDDLVDMCSQALNWVRFKRTRQAEIWSPADMQIPALAGVPTGSGSILRA